LDIAQVTVGEAIKAREDRTSGTFVPEATRPLSEGLRLLNLNHEAQ
jgi:hypothetical protein